MSRRARTQVELDFRKVLLHGAPFIRLQVTEFANGNRLHRFHFKLGGRDRLHGVVAPASLWATRISLKILRDAGLGDADLAKGKVVPIRRRVIEACAVTSWAQLHAA